MKTTIKTTPKGNQITSHVNSKETADANAFLYDTETRGKSNKRQGLGLSGPSVVSPFKIPNYPRVSEPSKMHESGYPPHMKSHSKKVSKGDHDLQSNRMILNQPPERENLIAASGRARADQNNEYQVFA